MLKNSAKLLQSYSSYDRIFKYNRTSNDEEIMFLFVVYFYALVVDFDKNSKFVNDIYITTHYIALATIGVCVFCATTKVVALFLMSIDLVNVMCYTIGVGKSLV